MSDIGARFFRHTHRSARGGAPKVKFPEYIDKSKVKSIELLDNFGDGKARLRAAGGLEVPICNLFAKGAGPNTEDIHNHGGKVLVEIARTCKRKLEGERAEQVPGVATVAARMTNNDKERRAAQARSALASRGPKCRRVSTGTVAIV